MSSSSRPPRVVSDLPALPPRAPDSHKGTFGRILVVAGSRGMSGAAALCGLAALRGGAGLVRLAVPDAILTTVASLNPCYTTAPLPSDADGRLAGEAEAAILYLAQDNDVVVAGPGLGNTESVARLIVALLQQTQTPLVLDADALNVLQGRTEALKRGSPTVITPHPAEFGRLSDLSVSEVQSNRQEAAVRFARDHDVTVVLKGNHTVVTDGTEVFTNTTGNAGMATGGTGDVLTGLVGALLGQGLEPFAAGQLGAYLHGLAGDLARDRLGEVSLIATDLLDFLPQAFTKGRP